MQRFAKQIALASHPADLDGHVHEFSELQGERLERRQLRGDVSCVYHGQSKRLSEQRVVVVDVPCHVGMRARDGHFGDKGTARSPKNSDGLYPSSLVCDEV